jgi:hypothetical protein
MDEPWIDQILWLLPLRKKRKIGRWEGYDKNCTLHHCTIAPLHHCTSDQGKKRKRGLNDG